MKKITLIMMMLILLTTLSCGGGGGDDPIIPDPEDDILKVDEIQGPTQVNERTTVNYSINAYGDTGITYIWSCAPPEAGEFTAPTLKDTAFTVAMVGADLPFEVRVEVMSDHHTIRKARNKAITSLNCFKVFSEVGESQQGDQYYLGSYDASGHTYFCSSSWVQNDMYIGKYDLEGDLMWDASWDDPTSTAQHTSFLPQITLSTFATDIAGNILIYGSFYGAADFDPGPDTYELLSSLDAPSTDNFFVKLDPEGNFLWAKQGMSELYYRYSPMMKFGLYNEIYLFGGRISSNHPKEIYLIKYSSDLTMNWMKTWGGVAVWGDSKCDSGSNMVIDSEGNLILNGLVVTGTDLDPGPGIDYWEAGAFMIKMTPSGIYLWGHTVGAYPGSVGVGGYTVECGECVVMNSSGDIYVLYAYKYGGGGDVDFAPGPDVDLHQGYTTPCVALSKYNSEGIYMWTIDWYSHLRLKGSQGVYIDNGNDIYISASDYQSNTHMLIKLDGDGGLLWEEVWTPYQNSYELAICHIDDNGYIYGYGGIPEYAAVDVGYGDDAKGWIIIPPWWFGG